MARKNDLNRKYKEERKLLRIKYANKYVANNPEKKKAQSLVWNFLRFHKELKPNKSFISWESWIIHLHHFDYLKPNQVIPCTAMEHSKIHRWLIEIKDEHILILPF